MPSAIGTIAFRLGWKGFRSKRKTSQRQSKRGGRTKHSPQFAMPPSLGRHPIKSFLFAGSIHCPARARHSYQMKFLDIVKLGRNGQRNERNKAGRQTMRCERSELDEEFGEYLLFLKPIDRCIWGFIRIVGPDNVRRRQWEHIFEGPKGAGRIEVGNDLQSFRALEKWTQFSWGEG